jgi:hypothetical protein
VIEYGCVLKEVAKVWYKNWLLDERGMVVDVPPEEVVTNSTHLLYQNTDVGYSQIWLL